MKSLRTALEKKLTALAFILLVIQPFLDVLSYFLSEMGSNTISTLLRFAMLAVVALLGFLMTERKRAYFCIYGVMAAYWVLHVLNCYRIGYLSVVQDTANYLRILTFPIFLLTFLTFFRNSGEGMQKVMWIGFAVNMGLSLLFTLLPLGLSALGLCERVYTYEGLEVGVMGWFAIPNAQSCIIVLLSPLTLLLAYRSKKPWVFLLACLVCFGMMFVTGTKLTFYTIFLIPMAFILVFLLNPGRKQALPYIGMLLGVMVLAVVFRGYSPMQIRENMTDYSQGQYSNLVKKSLSDSGASDEVLESILKGEVDDLEKRAEKDKDDKTSEEERRDAVRRLMEVRRSLMGVYTDPGTYGKLLFDLNDRFGVYNVMAVYHYSADTANLSNLRTRKMNYAKLVWSECDVPTKILGFEYSQMLHNGNIYDLENDFPAVYYNCGCLGFALYLLLFGYIVYEVLSAFFCDPLHYLTPEVGAAGMTFVLALGAAQISGYVLRRPNVAIYLAVVSAYLCYLSVDYRRQHPEPFPWLKWTEKLRKAKK